MLRESRIIATKGKLTVAGEFIQEARLKHNMSCEELARKMQEQGIPMKRELVFRMERGQRMVTIEEASILATILDIDGNDLIKYIAGQIEQNCNSAIK